MTSKPQFSNVYLGGNKCLYAIYVNTVYEHANKHFLKWAVRDPTSLYDYVCHNTHLEWQRLITNQKRDENGTHIQGIHKRMVRFQW